MGSVFWYRVIKALFQEVAEEVALLHGRVHAKHQKAQSAGGRKAAQGAHFAGQDRIFGVHMTDWEEIFDGRFDAWGYNWTSLMAFFYKKMLSLKDKQLKLRLANKSVKSGKQHYSMHGIEIVERARYSYRARDAPPSGFLDSLSASSLAATLDWASEEFGIGQSRGPVESAPTRPNLTVGATRPSLEEDDNAQARDFAVSTSGRHKKKNFAKVRVYAADERRMLAFNMGQVIDALLIIHKLDYIPFSVLSFALADTIYWSTVGHRDEKDRRRGVFRFVAEHPSGKVKGLEDLFDGSAEAPMLSTSMRVMHLRKTAENLLHSKSNMDLSAADVERYVRHLRFEHRETVKQCMEAFSKAATLTFERDQSTEAAPLLEGWTQTTFECDQQVQTQHTAEQGMETEYIMPAPTQRGHTKPKSTKELASELMHFASVEAHMHYEAVDAREQAEVAKREEELMREELAAVEEQQRHTKKGLHAHSSEPSTEVKEPVHLGVLKEAPLAPSPPAKKKHWMFARRGQPGA